MFLDLTLRRNPGLIETAIRLHQKGIISPDTYVLDLDNILRNAGFVKNEADRYGIKLYFMTKQFGRNPYISKEIMNLGYDGAVAVDFREANILYKNGIKLGNVGHLVQVPSSMIETMLGKNPEVITVYSYDKILEISMAAKKLNKLQNIMLRVVDKDDVVYPGQAGGFPLENLIAIVEKIIMLPNVKIYGLTSFPCFLMDFNAGKVKETNNLRTVLKAKTMIEQNFGIKIAEINTPSITCSKTIKQIAELGGTHGEPGHGLLGTTPLNVVEDLPEIPSIVYVSEISHNYEQLSYCYGGGYYCRSLIKNALVGRKLSTMKKVEVETPSNSNIDYYIGLKENSCVGDTAIFAFRTQIFVTRSEVAIVRGINSGKPQVVGIYDSQGRFIREGD